MRCLSEEPELANAEPVEAIAQKSAIAVYRSHIAAPYPPVRRYQCPQLGVSGATAFDFRSSISALHFRLQFANAA
jgi:hypothetical protein